jgi:hypothetical protein
MSRSLIQRQHLQNPQPNPARVRKTPITHGVVREGIYRIASAIRRNDAVGFLELQEDDTIKAVALNEASDGQKVRLTPSINALLV